MRSFISLEEAIEILNLNVSKLDKEKLSLINCVNRIIFEDVTSMVNSPPFNKSAMDGYAIISEDTLKGEALLEIVGEIYAGDSNNIDIDNGKAIKIMTGAKIPKGANSVIKKEEVLLEGNKIIISRQVKLNENICFMGEDIKENDLIIKEGKKLNYADIGILAACGIKTINVYKKPKIAFISTGDEVVDITERLDDGKIFNSNKYTILARLKELGYDISYISHVSDSYKKIGEDIMNACKVSDLIISTGGVSVGDKDLLKEAIDYANGEKLFWKVKIKPGSALLASKVNNKLVISLSGNPTAAITTFELLVKPILSKFMGQDRVNIKRDKGILINEFNKKSKQRRYLRGKVITNEKGQFVEITQIKSGNGILSSTINSNCLIELEEGNEGVKSGDTVNIIKIYEE